jgi:hypothetical protein
MKNILIVVGMSLLIACSDTDQVVEQGNEQYVAPGNYQNDADTWGNLGEEVTIKGCEDWKERNEGADC